MLRRGSLPQYCPGDEARAMSSLDTPVAVVGGGVVGCAVLHALARRGVAAVLLEAEPALALGASGTNSGILHTGFDSAHGELETRMIIRSGELRGQLLEELGVPVWRCGAELRPRGEQERLRVAEIAGNAAGNGIEARLGAGGVLEIPGESVVDPVAYTEALARAAQAGGATVMLDSPVIGLRAHGEHAVRVFLAGEILLRAGAVVNCAGLYADRIARLAGDESFAIHPRKGEFLVFRMPSRAVLERILLPVPSPLGKGILVFPTLAGELVAGPTAREREDKEDWSVETDAAETILARAGETYPPLQTAERIGSYAGLRPAGDGFNYLIAFSRPMRRLLHVAAIRSTGLSASLGIGEYVAGLLEREGAITLGPPRALPAPARTAPRAGAPWWARTARHREARRGEAGAPA
jgi:glycerol-3-phosphate dehydrogenase